MKFTIHKWPVKKLVNLAKRKKLTLNPPYQRNPVWTVPAQKELIDSIRCGYPLPSFFLHLQEDGTYDMVDGQQRTRTLIKYLSGSEIDISKDDSKFKTEELPKYLLSVVVIEDVGPGEYIEDFYYRVNKYGLRINRPEELKSKHHNKLFLELVQKLVTSPDFVKLELVSDRSSNRMLDRDLVEELCALIKVGITDKKTRLTHYTKTM